MASVSVTQSVIPGESNEKHPQALHVQAISVHEEPDVSELNQKIVSPDQSHFIVSSPYHEPDHLLDLTTLDTPNQLLARALTALTAVREDYATAPYIEALNWSAVFASLRELSREANHTWKKQSFYVVVFKSILLPDANLNRLHELDFHSHREAVESGGLLKYWFGTKNERRENLATCLWRSREDARLGGLGPWHRLARAAAKEMYERIEFTTLELVVGDEVGSWEFKKWADQV